MTVINYSQTAKKSNLGFTLVELVIVLVLLGVLSVSVLPKFLTTSGFDEVTYRDRLIALLRLQQVKAMYNTQEDCHRVLITAGASGRFGITYNGNNIDCTVNTLPADYSQIGSQNLNRPHHGLSESEASSSVSFSGHDIFFNPLGCPTANVACNDNDISISITGEASYSVCIESQGYIHAGSCD